MRPPEEFFGKSIKDLLEEIDFNFPEFDPPKKKKKTPAASTIQRSVCKSKKCERYHPLAEEFCNINCALDEKSRKMIEDHQRSKSKK